MGWNLLPNEIKKHTIEYTGGFKPIHSKNFHKSLDSISKRKSVIVCYMCGINNALTNKGLKRNPSTRLYAKKGPLAIEIFARCSEHPLCGEKENILVIPRHIEKDCEIIKYVNSMFVILRFIYIFNTNEDSNYNWRVIGRRSFQI